MMHTPKVESRCTSPASAAVRSAVILCSVDAEAMRSQLTTSLHLALRSLLASTPQAYVPGGRRLADACLQECSYTQKLRIALH